MILRGELSSVNNPQILESILKEYSGDTIQIIDIREGSIKLIIKGSKKHIIKLLTNLYSSSNIKGKNLRILAI